MGAGNVKAVYALWPNLPDKPFRALTYMAVTSLDNDNPPVFKKGWESLAYAIGRRIPDEDPYDKAVCRQRRAALVAVTVAVKVLLDSGAIKILLRPAPGRRTTHYALNLDGFTVQGNPEPSAADPDDESGPADQNGSGLPDATVQGYASDGSGSACSTVQGNPEPKEYEEYVRTGLEEESSDLRTAVTVTRARGSAKDRVFSAGEGLTFAHCGRSICVDGIVVMGNIERECRQCRWTDSDE